MIPKDTKQPIMEVKDLIREFPAGDEKIRVLHGIDLTIYEGEMVAIIGQSGSGKSTLMNILGCLDQATGKYYHIWGAVTNSPQTNLPSFAVSILGLFFSAIIYSVTSMPKTMSPSLPYAGMPVRQREARATQLLDDLGLGANQKSP